ncbi:MAG TPA: DNA topoisomerase IV subunit B, partial [Gammaproteobacteria bacterium]|nr:DNA topoisomerase IV subunit B [Gammaproteobacteria bacterium]
MKFKDGDKASELKVIDKVGKRNTGTTVKFLPNAKYFDSVKISIPKLKHVLRAKAVLCSGLNVRFIDNTVSKEKSLSEQWCFEDGLSDYLTQATAEFETLPTEPFVGSVQGNDEAVDWAIQWLP